MLVVIAYDIEDDRRRNRVAKTLEGYGDRVQESVFECWLEARQLGEVKAALAGLIDADRDRVRYYRLCRKDTGRVLWDGLGAPPRDRLVYMI